MNTKIVYQTNPLGLYVGPIEAEESPLEPGVFLIPGGCVPVPPPADIPEFKAACWSGKTWQLLDYFNGLIVYNTTNREPLTLTSARSRTSSGRTGAGSMTSTPNWPSCTR